MTEPEPVSERIAGLVLLLLVGLTWLGVGAVVYVLAHCGRG